MPMLPPRSRMLRVRKTSRTMPGALCMWNTLCSAVTMPAASCPRCCSSNSPSYNSWLTGDWATIPRIPHMGADFPGVVKDQLYFKRSARAGGSHGFKAVAAAASCPPASESLHPALLGKLVNPAASAKARMMISARSRPNNAPSRRSSPPRPAACSTLESQTALFQLAERLIGCLAARERTGAHARQVALQRLGVIGQLRARELGDHGVGMRKGADLNRVFTRCGLRRDLGLRCGLRRRFGRERRRVVLGGNPHAHRRERALRLGIAHH